MDNTRLDSTIVKVTGLSKTFRMGGQDVYALKNVNLEIKKVSSW